MARLRAIKGALTAGLAAAAAHVPAQGTLTPTRNLRAVAVPFLRMTPMGAPLQVGERRGFATIEVANSFILRPGLTEDVEIHRLNLVGRWGMRWGELSVEVPLLSRGGGFLDPIIDTWHANVLRWSDPARDAAPYGRSIVKLDGTYRFGSASGLGDASVGIGRAFGPRTYARVAIKLPTGSASMLLGSGGVDAGASIEQDLPLGRRWQMAFQGGVVLQGRATTLPGARRWVEQAAVGLAWLPNSRDRWSVQWQHEASPIRTGAPGADGPHRLITFAYRRRLDGRRDLELYFSEDRDLFTGQAPELANLGPDFTIGVRMGFRF